MGTHGPPWAVTPLLAAFRASLPMAAGVVLASPQGEPLESDAPDAGGLAREALALRGPGQSALVPRGDTFYLVVFLSGSGTAPL